MIPNATIRSPSLLFIVIYLNLVFSQVIFYTRITAILLHNYLLILALLYTLFIITNFDIFCNKKKFRMCNCVVQRE